MTVSTAIYLHCLFGISQNRDGANSPIVPNMIPVDLVQENWGVYQRQSDKRRYAPLFIRIAYSEFLLRFVTLPIHNHFFFG